MVVLPSQASGACVGRTSVWTIIFHDSMPFKPDLDLPRPMKRLAQAPYGIPPSNGHSGACFIAINRLLKKTFVPSGMQE